MRDDRSRSPQRGWEAGMEDLRGYDGQDQGDSHHQSRQGRRDYSRSPPRQTFYQDRRENYPRHPRDLDRSRSYQGHRWGRDGERSPARGGGGDPYRSRYDGHDVRNYETMYDDVNPGEDDGRSSRSRTGDWDGTLRPDDRRHWRNNDSASGHSPDSGRYTRSRSHSRTRDAGKPSDTVMLEGLPFGISTSSLREALFHGSIAGELSGFDVRVTSSRGNCRAFVQFADIDCAITFVKEHFPELHLQLPQSTDDVPDGKLSVYIHYARSQGDADNGHGPTSVQYGDWDCANCGFSNFSSRSKCKKCSSSPSDPTKAGPDSRTGACDTARQGDPPVQTLVVYPLPPNVDEDMLEREMRRLELDKSDKPKEGPNKLRSTAPSETGAGYGAPPGSLHRVFLMRDVATNANYRYGFAEFWHIPAAVAALKKVLMTRCFRIGGTVVNISMIHLGVFIPEERQITPEIERESFLLLVNQTMRVRYRDPWAYPSIRVVNAHPPPVEGPAKVVAEAKPISQKPKKRKADDGPGESMPKKTSIMAAQMATWNRAHEELQGKSDSDKGSTDKATRDGPIKFSMPDKIGATKSNKPVKVEAQEESAPESRTVSWIDWESLQCRVCLFQYKSIEECKIHEKSQNHAKEMQDEAKIKKARDYFAKRRRLQQQQKQPADATQQYRDRAQERRETHNQPSKPVTAPHAGKPIKSDPKNKVKEEVKTPVASKAAGMLAKMGWTAGSGLGAQGEGTTEALTVNAYKEGVGLGADGGKLGDAAEIAESRTVDSYASYVAGAKQKARERYNQLG